MADTRCAALYRVSTQKQVRHGVDEDTIPLQRTAIREFLTKYHPDWQLVTEWAEEGVSAYRNSSADRDIVQDVLRAAARKQFEVLLLFKADRLSRRSLEYPVVLAQLKRFGVATVAVADQVGGRELETDGQYDKLVRFIEGWQAETESYNTSIRVSEAMRQKSLRGEWLGGRPPYGFRVARLPGGKAALEIDPDEAATVRRIFDWYLDEGLGMTAITKRLNAEGVRTRHRSAWHLNSVRRVLLSPLACGRMTYGRTRRGQKANTAVHVNRKDWDEKVVVTGHSPELQIVDPERWDAAFARLRSYNGVGSEHHRGEGNAFLLSGLLRCGTCGGPVYGRTTMKKRRADGSPVKRPWYVCNNRRTRGTTVCSGQMSYSKQKVEATVLASVLRVLGESADREHVIARAKEIAEQSLFHSRVRGEEARRRIDEARRVHQAWVSRLDAFFANPSESLYDEELLARKAKESAGRVAALEAELEGLAAAEGQAATQMKELERFLARATNWWRVFLAASPEDQKRIIRQIVDHVAMSRDGYTIFYRIEAGPEVAALEWREAAGWSAARG
jgi:DNA invertase Pin-like site-specific DNA recombinase